MSLIPFINILISFVMALIGMAFFTLLERKILGYAQLRKGPNKVGISGIPQPFADALKLLAKEQSKPSLANFLPFLAAPIMSLFLALIIWMLYPSSYPTHFFIFGTLFFLCVSSLNVYTTLAAGWSSNSKYSLLGALRSVAQTISYEVSMALILLSALILILSFDIAFINLNNSSWIILLMAPLFSTWFTTTLAETNRTPFDFAEGESELVSGFNTEYSAGSFALIFMAEYTNIIMMSLLTSIFFFGSVSLPILNNFFLLLKTTFLAFLFLWIRASFPRMRYDRLMNLTWKSFLPFSLGALMLLTPISFFLL
uniref:NADH dehydrogenase subunit 1 n=1 Tax=Hyperhalosydna striata TaxID=1210421 RepID=UPI002008EC93|nr:NADH dehydrogenase subunit 1 [Hyperhalosydna striata]QTZ18391.1 NADH dehydrogenase subunit 1 [Hyperhalosydna striata]